MLFGTAPGALITNKTDELSEIPSDMAKLAESAKKPLINWDLGDGDGLDFNGSG